MGESVRKRPFIPTHCIKCGSTDIKIKFNMENNDFYGDLNDMAYECKCGVEFTGVVRFNPVTEKGQHHP